MRRVLLALAVLFSLGFAWKYRCMGQHETVRDPATGGRRCIDCGQAFADMADSGEIDGDGRVSPLRRTFERDPLASIRSTGWSVRW